MTIRSQKLPIFSLFTVDELSRRLGVTKRYLCDLEDGVRPINPRFIKNACLFLNRSQEELFGPKEEQS